MFQLRPVEREEVVPSEVGLCPLGEILLGIGKRIGPFELSRLVTDQVMAVAFHGVPIRGQDARIVEAENPVVVGMG